MANPFLVLGGVAVGIVTAAFGVLSVPGWVASAQDGSTVNDLAHITDAESVHMDLHRVYSDDIHLLSGGLTSISALGAGGAGGIVSMAAPTTKDLFPEFALSPGVKLLHLGVGQEGKAYCAVAQSPSGTFFATSEDKHGSIKGQTAVEAMDAASCAPDAR